MLSQLPPELVVRVLEHLEPDFRSIAQSRLVCRAFNSLVTESGELRYQLKLAKHGYQKIPGSGSTSARNLAEFERHVSGWKDPSWKHRTVMDLFHEGFTYELQGGMFVEGRPSEEAGNRSTRGMLFYQLPWLDETADEEKLMTRSDVHSIEDLGVDVHDFQVDPSQNLLVLAERLTTSGPHQFIRVFLRSIDNNAPHPRAHLPLKVLNLPKAKEEEPLQVVGFIIQVMDDLIGVLTCYRNVVDAQLGDLTLTSSMVEVFNWHTGSSVLYLEKEGVDSIVFLDQKTLLLARRFPHVLGKRIELDVIQFDPDRPIHSDPWILDSPRLLQGGFIAASLIMPSIAASRSMITTIIGRCEPGLSYRNSPDLWPEYNTRPPRRFRPAQSSRLVTLSFITLQNQTAPFERQFTVAFFADTIRKLALETWKNADLEDLDETPTLDWEEWGPANTRFLECRTPSQWICYTYASRLLLMRPEAHGPRISIVDFHPARIAEYEAQTPGFGKRNRCFLHREPTTIKGQGTWGKDVITSLPYMEVVSQIEFKHVSGVMLDEERIIVSSHSAIGSRFTIFNI